MHKLESVLENKTPTDSSQKNRSCSSKQEKRTFRFVDFSVLAKQLSEKKRKRKDRLCQRS